MLFFDYHDAIIVLIRRYLADEKQEGHEGRNYT